MHKNKQINMEYIYIYIYIYDPYICLKDSIYAYMAIHTLVHSPYYIYIYIYICRARPKITACKPLMLQEAAVSIALRYKVLQKLLKVSIDKHLDSTGTVYT